MNKLVFPSEVKNIIEEVHNEYCWEYMNEFFDQKKGDCTLIKSFVEDIHSDGKTLFEKTIVCQPSELFEVNELSKEALKNSPHYNDLLTLYKCCYKKFTNIKIEEVTYDDVSIYSNLSTKRTIKELWSAQLMILLLKVKVCPYCNSNFIITLFKKGDQGSYFSKIESIEEISEIENELNRNSQNSAKIPNATVRPQLDHFLAKNNESYPFLAMSLYNLVPSCMVCNSYPLKGQINFTKMYSLNPYEYSIDDYVKFKIKEDGDPYEVITGLTQNFSIDYSINIDKYRSNVGNEELFLNNLIKAYYMLEFFHISEQYNYHKDYVRNQLIKKTIYTPIYLEQLNMAFGINLNTNLLEDKYEMENFSNQILGKLLKDIHESFF